MTLPDKYPVPNLYDFAHNLYDKKIFSEVGLSIIYFQISVAAEYIEKTAITTPFWNV